MFLSALLLSSAASVKANDPVPCENRGGDTPIVNVNGEPCENRGGDTPIVNRGGDTPIVNRTASSSTQTSPFQVMSSYAQEAFLSFLAKLPF